MEHYCLDLSSLLKPEPFALALPHPHQPCHGPHAKVLPTNTKLCCLDPSSLWDLLLTTLALPHPHQSCHVPSRRGAAHQHKAPPPGPEPQHQAGLARADPPGHRPQEFRAERHHGAP